MTSRTLQFESHTPIYTYSLLALPATLLPLLDAGSSQLEIRAQGSSAAVLVTPLQTYSLRGVQNSNSLLLCDTAQRIDADGEQGHRRTRRKLDTLVIQATLHETLELVATVPRWDELYKLLPGLDYRGQEEQAVGGLARKRLDLDDLARILPASDREILAALQTNRVAVLDDASLHAVAPAYRLRLLDALLESFASASAARNKAKGKGREEEKKDLLVASVALEELLDTLDAHDCSLEIATCFLGWYGQESESRPGVWVMEIAAIVKEVGVCCLAVGGHGEQHTQAFIEKWRAHCHRFWEQCQVSDLADVSLRPSSSTIRYFPPAHLSPLPAVRFAELFALKPRWTEAEMTPFIDDLVGGDRKKREALAQKFVRKILEKGQVVGWSSRSAA